VFSGTFQLSPVLLAGGKVLDVVVTRTPLLLLSASWAGALVTGEAALAPPRHASTLLRRAAVLHFALSKMSCNIN
jgi:hypothetical protein